MVQLHAESVFQMRVWWDTEKDLLIQRAEMKMNPEEEGKRGHSPGKRKERQQKSSEKESDDV